MFCWIGDGVDFYSWVFYADTNSLLIIINNQTNIYSNVINWIGSIGSLYS